jgi:[acyl-carrier-protein] S-malonyltransferase
VDDVAARGSSPPPDPVVAVVAGRPIHVSDVDRRIAAMRRGPRGRHLPAGDWIASAGHGRWILQELVTEAVIAHEARAARPADIVGPPAEGPAEDASAPVSAAAIADLVDRVTASVAVDDGEVRAYYERNCDRYRRPEARRVRHVLTTDEPSARGIVDRVLAGEDLAGLAASESIDRGSRGQGGDLGDIHRGELAGALEDAIFGAPAWAVRGPVRTEHGWHVVRVEGSVPETAVAFDEARAEIEAELLAAARIAAFGAWLEARSSELTAIEPGYEHPAHPIHGLQTHRH